MGREKNGTVGWLWLTGGIQLLLSLLAAPVQLLPGHINARVHCCDHLGRMGGVHAAGLVGGGHLGADQGERCETAGAAATALLTTTAGTTHQHQGAR